MVNITYSKNEDTVYISNVSKYSGSGISVIVDELSVEDIKKLLLIKLKRSI